MRARVAIYCGPVVGCAACTQVLSSAERSRPASLAMRMSSARSPTFSLNRTDPICKSIVATDFFRVEIWTSRGLIRHWVLFVIDLPNRRIEIAGISSVPCGTWTEHVVRSLLDDFDGFLLGKRYLIHDRDSLFTGAFENPIRVAGIQPIRLPPRSSNLKAYAERFVRSIKTECLDQMIIFGEQRLRDVIDEYVEHYHRQRPHQGAGNVLIQPTAASL